jgi:hypothetical protein
MHAIRFLLRAVKIVWLRSLLLSVSFVVASMSLVGSVRADGPQPEPTLSPDSFPNSGVGATQTTVEGYSDCVTWSKTTSVPGPDGQKPVTFIERFTSCRNKLTALNGDPLEAYSPNGVSSLVQYAPGPTYKCPLGHGMNSQWEFQAGSNISWVTSYQQGSNFGTFPGFPSNNVARYFSYSVGPLGGDIQIYTTKATATSGSIIAGLGTSCFQ